MAGNNRAEAGQVRRATVRMVACVSLDGKIATTADAPPNQEKYGGWTSAEDKKLFKEQVSLCHAVVMGHKTWQISPHMAKPTWVVSANKTVIPNVNGILAPTRQCLENWLASMDGRVLLCGGAKTYSLFLQHDLVDEMVLTLEPVVLNTGPSLADSGLFNTEAKRNKFKRMYCRDLDGGAVSISFLRVR
jgi:dihydrofolate reductase